MRNKLLLFTVKCNFSSSFLEFPLRRYHFGFLLALAKFFGAVVTPGGGPWLGVGGRDGLELLLTGLEVEGVYIPHDMTIVRDPSLWFLMAASLIMTIREPKSC